MVAILENYQKPDGTIQIPEVLRKYVGGQETIPGPRVVKPSH
jgi:seryl-tRNA synthetase